MIDLTPWRALLDQVHATYPSRMDLTEFDQMVTEILALCHGPTPDPVDVDAHLRRWHDFRMAGHGIHPKET